MTQDYKYIAEQTTESGLVGSTDQPAGKLTTGIKAPATDLASKVDSLKCFGFG